MLHNTRLSCLAPFGNEGLTQCFLQFPVRTFDERCLALLKLVLSVLFAWVAKEL